MIPSGSWLFIAASLRSITCLGLSKRLGCARGVSTPRVPSDFRKENPFIANLYRNFFHQDPEEEEEDDDENHHEPEDEDEDEDDENHHEPDEEEDEVDEYHHEPDELEEDDEDEDDDDEDAEPRAASNVPRYCCPSVKTKMPALV